MIRTCTAGSCDTAVVLAVLVVEHIDHLEGCQHVLAELLANAQVPQEERRQATRIEATRAVGSGGVEAAECRAVAGTEHGGCPVTLGPDRGSRSAALPSAACTCGSGSANSPGRS
ncbi:hypothetical protein G6F63_015371 [Rhizopus arrhizus]|nr:hypothetical protein G6F63_015371 [Rhizopus arrhizus]